jgi:uncharacterized membrane protein
MTDPLEPRRDSGPPPSSTGLEDNVGGMLCYLLGFVSAIAFLILERENQSIRFHAYQSLATFGGLFVLSVASSVVPFFGWLLGVVLAPVSVILWLVLMVKTLQDEPIELPVVGEWAREQSER